MEKENIYIDLRKCSEKERNHIFSLLPNDEITAQIYFMIRKSYWEVLKAFSHLFFNENSAWQLCSNRSTETTYKTELTYPEFIKLFEGETCPKCRTKDFENCHSIRCPMRDEKLFEDGDGERKKESIDYKSEFENLKSLVLSDSVFWCLRRGIKNPSDFDFEDYGYIELNNWIKANSNQ